MEFNLVYQELIIIGAIIYLIGLIIPNYFRFRYVKINKKENKLNQNQELKLIPAKKLGMIKSWSEISFWILSLFIIVQILNILSFFSQNFFFFTSNNLPNIFTYVALCMLLIGSIFAFIVGKELGKDFSLIVSYLTFTNSKQP